MAVLTVKIKFPRDFFQLRDTPEMRRQLLDVPSIESLTGFYEVQVMFLKLPFFYRLLFLSILLADLL